VPYTYVVKCIPTGKRYYGVRFRKGCNPADLWVTYFTSSLIVHREISKYGKEAFVTEIRRTFTSNFCARHWEHRVLQKLRVPFNGNWYNGANGVATAGMEGKHHSIESRLKISSKMSGHKLSEEHCQNLCRAWKNHQPHPIVVCPHCQLKGRLGPMRRWHFDHCRSLRIPLRQELKVQLASECPSFCRALLR
jgi:hypothetical protein